MLHWSGVLIEANPTMCTALRHNRPNVTCLCTVVSSDYSPIVMEKGLATSGFGEVAQMDSLLRTLHPHPGKYLQYKVCVRCCKY